MKPMNPTKEHYEALAKVFQIGQTGDDEGWEDLFIDEDSADPTRDHIEFYDGSQWVDSSGKVDIEADGFKGIYWDEAKAMAGSPRLSLAVIDCGDFRLVYQQ